MKDFDTLQEILKRVKANIKNTKHNYIKEHYNEINGNNEEVKSFIFKQIENIEKATKKNLQKLKDIEDFLYIFLEV